MWRLVWPVSRGWPPIPFGLCPLAYTYFSLSTFCPYSECVTLFFWMYLLSFISDRPPRGQQRFARASVMNLLLQFDHFPWSPPANIHMLSTHSARAHYSRSLLPFADSLSPPSHLSHLIHSPTILNTSVAQSPQTRTISYQCYLSSRYPAIIPGFLGYF